MLTPRNLAILAAAAGALVGMPWNHAQACDNDRFPCPVVSDAPAQDSTDAGRTAPSGQSKKKPTQAAQQGDKPAAKSERDTAQAPAHPKASKHTAQDQAEPAQAAKPIVQAPAIPAVTPAAQAVEAAPPVQAVPEPPRSAAAAPAPAAAPVSAEAASAPVATPAVAAPQVAAPVKVVDPNEVNELDLAAAAPAPAPAETSWLSYLLVTLGGALAAASTVRLFLF
jgi:hypothetical protein